MDSRIRSVAVIDDDDRVRESLHNLLTSYGYRAEAYASAELFLASDGLSKSLCIVADVQMRDRKMSGLALLQYVRSSHSDIPVIIITGKPSAYSEAFYLDRGANGFFRKPIDGQALMALIDHLST
ncbi:response regulator transcription factor [Collimonas silvisoli]|uniref:response regulator transcription factor n=1 Tax=Collimonas silvisoli TaxID=2825884 RepID=UPI001B8C00B2|nr:response regulator [Collimonas silvisoli]